jgi:hypothetical protein
MNQDIFLTCLCLDCIVIILPLLLMISIPKKSFMNWKELQEKHPHIKNDNLGLIGFLGALFLSLGLMYLSQKYNNDYYFSIVFLIVSIGYMISGVWSLRTKLYGYSYKPMESARYFYDEDNKYSWIAKLQISSSAIITLVIFYLIFIK